MRHWTGDETTMLPSDEEIRLRLDMLTEIVRDLIVGFAGLLYCVGLWIIWAYMGPVLALVMLVAAVVVALAVPRLLDRYATRREVL